MRKPGWPQLVNAPLFWGRVIASPRIFVLASIVTLALSVATYGADRVWTNGNATYENALSWSNGAPTAVDRVIFNDSAAITNYAVGLNATETVANVLFSAVGKGVFWKVSNSFPSNVWTVSNSFILDQSAAATAVGTLRNGILAVTNVSGTAVFDVGSYTSGGKGLFRLEKQSAADLPTLIVDNFVVTSNSTFNFWAGTLTVLHSSAIDRGTNVVFDMGSLSGDTATWNIQGGSNAVTFLGTAVGTNRLAITTGGTANVNVSGANTVLTLGGAELDVGYNGFGNLTISGGAHVTNNGIAYVSRFGASSSNNAATVTGAGSQWNVGGELRVGNAAASNVVTIAAGGVVNSTSGRLGEGAGSSNNVVTVTGVNSQWNMTDFLQVGGSIGGNSLIISNGGLVSNAGAFARLGRDTNSANNAAMVDGAGSQWKVNTDLVVGNNGSANTVTVKNGGQLTTVNGTLSATGSSSNNSVVVDGAGSLWLASGVIQVGAAGSANQLTASNAGEVRSAGLILSSGASSSNAVLVSGGMLEVTNATTNAVLNVGSSGKGIFTVSGGTITLDSLVVTNTLSGAVINTNQFTFNGGVVTNRNGGTVNNGQLLAVGDSVSAATLNLLGGTGTFVDGLQITNNGTLNIDRLSASVRPTISVGTLLVNSNATFNLKAGTLTTLNGATIDRGTNAVFDIQPATGELATWNIQGGTNSINYIGSVGTNRLGTGTPGSSTLTLNISGANTLLKAGGAQLAIGWNNAVNINISGGAVLSNGLAQVGANSTGGSNNIITVSGAGSQWNSGTLNVGDISQSNSLTVSSGGQLNSLNSGLGILASANNNLVTIGGTNSLWIASGLVEVGRAGSGNQLTVTNAGEARVTGLTVSSGASSNNIVLISGSKLSVTNATTNAVLNVGSVGKGTFTFNGGSVIVDQLLLTNGANSVFTFNSGVLTNRAGGTVSNGQAFVVGNGVGAATLNLLGGTSTFADGLVITNSAGLNIDRLSANTRPVITSGNLLVNSNATFTFKSGTLTTLNGSTIDRGTNGQFDVAPASGDTVTWNIQGGNNAITYLGVVGTNRLAFTSGGAVNVNVSGAATTWKVGGNEFDIGWNGAVNLFVSGGALVTNSGIADLSRNGLSSTNNAVTVTGSGSQWNIGGELRLGNAAGSNSVTIAAGAVTRSFSGNLGQGLGGSNNLVTVTGANSVWNMTDFLQVGTAAGGNALIITNGGRVNNANVGRLGRDITSANNRVVVDGAGSLWNDSSVLQVGSNGANNSVTIKNGGQMASTSAVLGLGASSSNNAVAVDGAGSWWVAGGGIEVGQGGSSNQLAISNSGEVRATGLTVSSALSSNNTVSVSGGTLAVTNATTSAMLNVGSAGKGAFTFNSGNVIADQLLLTNGVNSKFTFNGGTLSTQGAFVTNGSSFIVGNGATAATWNMQNGAHSLAGGLGVSALGSVIANTARLDISGTVTNSGTLSMVNSVGRFSGPVVNSGAWITDPTTNTFANTYTVTSSGYIAASAGDVYEFQKDFVNQSTQSNTWNTLNVTPGSSGANATKFILDGDSAGGTQQFFHAGLQLTGGFSGSPVPTSNGVQFVTSFGAVEGFQSNFALGRLEIGNLDTNSIVLLSDSFANGAGTGALFVDDLFLFGTSDLIISNNMQVYFVNSNTWTMSSIELLGNAGIHQLQLSTLTVVPEPGVLLLWACGLGVMYGARRRARNRSGTR